MMNLLLFLVALTCLGITAAWMAETPGQVTMYWFDYRIDTSVAVLLLAVVVFIVLIACVVLIIRRIVVTPRRIRQARRLSHYERGMRELTYSVAALAAADPAGAQTHTKKAEKLLGRTPLTIMLSAQIARSRGDDKTTRLLLEQLLDHKETEYLAARSLSDVANQQQIFPRALNLAQRAYDIGPKDHTSTTALVSLHVKLGHWQEALSVVRRAGRMAYASRTQRKRHQGLVHLQYGRTLLAGGRTDEAVDQARSALALIGDFIPAILFAADAYSRGGYPKRAIATLQRAFKTNPHPQIIAAMRKLVGGESQEYQRKFLAPMIEKAQPNAGTQWGCTACGHAQETWELHCPKCSAFDSMAWK